MTTSSSADAAVGTRDDASMDVPEPPVLDAESKSAEDTKQNQSIRTSDDKENQKPEFPFFKERREPWFWFNNTAFLISLGVFLYFTVTIVQEFINNRNDPPTATNLVNGLSQTFPGMAFCTYGALSFYNITQPDLIPIYASFYDYSENDWIDKFDQLKQVDCPSSPQNHKCWYLDGTYLAFDNTVGNSLRNILSFGFELNFTEYSSDVNLLGVDGYLFEHFDDFLEVYYPECAGADSALPTEDDCPGDSTATGLESFFASTTTYNLVQLRRSETQTDHPRCDTKFRVDWDPSIVNAEVNPKWLEKLNITVTGSIYEVLMDIQFYNFNVAKTTFNPQSGVSMFGSLSGWFGFLSDGWGILSLLFIVEELISYFCKLMGVRKQNI